MDDIFDMTDEMRRNIPEIIKNSEGFLNYVKSNFLLIEKRDLLNSAIGHMETVISMLQTTVISLYIYHQNTQSDEAYKQVGLHIQKCEALEKFAESLKKNGDKLDKVQIVQILEKQVKDEVKLLENLLTYVELCLLTEEDNEEEES